MEVIVIVVTETMNKNDDREIIQTVMELNVIVVSNDLYRDCIDYEVDPLKQ